MERLTEKRDGQNIIPLRQDGKLKWELCSAGMGDAPAQFLYGAHADKLAEYEDLEEQWKLLKLPCAVGDTVWYISDRVEKQGRKKTTALFVDQGAVDNITVGCLMVPQISICNDENIWTTFDSVEDFGKTVFLTREEAEAALERRAGD